MTNQTLKELFETIEASNESIDIELLDDRLIIKAKKNSPWIALSVLGMALSILLITFYDKRANNLEIGLVLLFLSIHKFWRIQSINKTVIFDLHEQTLSVIPNFVLQRIIFSKLLKSDLTLSLNDLPDISLVKYRNLKYHWTQRLSIKRGIWIIYLLEFDKKETAEKVLELLKH